MKDLPADQREAKRSAEAGWRALGMAALTMGECQVSKGEKRARLTEKKRDNRF